MRGASGGRGQSSGRARGRGRVAARANRGPTNTLINAGTKPKPTPSVATEQQQQHRRGGAAAACATSTHIPGHRVAHGKTGPDTGKSREEGKKKLKLKSKTRVVDNSRMALTTNACECNTAADRESEAHEEKRTRAATTIARAVLVWGAREQVATRRQRKEEMLAEMAAIEHDAWVRYVRAQQEQERQRLAAIAEIKAKRAKRMALEQELRDACFDGDYANVQRLLDVHTTCNDGEPLSVECADANGERPLLEAAGGGHPAVCHLLVERSADVNCRGKYNRTPLFRAAFGGHDAAVRCLLMLGADPRLYDHEGATPGQVASGPAVQALAEWNLEDTDRLAPTVAARADAMRAIAQQTEDHKVSDLQRAVEHARREHDARQCELRNACMDFEKRAYEYDLCTNGPESRPESVVAAVLAAVRDAEVRVTHLRPIADDAAAVYQHAKAMLRRHELESRRKTSCAASDTNARLGQGDGRPGYDGSNGVDEGGEVPTVDVSDVRFVERCTIREFDEVVWRDVGGSMRAQPWWPLIIDLSGQVGTFLRYRDTNYLNARSQWQLESNTLRRALLGAVRYGKPLVLDMGHADVFSSVCDAFDTIYDGLSKDVLTKKILHPSSYERLIRESDGLDYDPVHFTDRRLANFWVYFVTTAPLPSDDACRRLAPVEVVPVGPPLLVVA